MNEIATTNQHFDLSPRSLEEAMHFADMLSNSGLVPKDYIGKPGNILVAIQWGMELGLKPMQAMQNLAVINGRPSLWGDAVLALVLASPVCEDVIEFYEGTGDDYAAVCIAKRKGKEDKSARFSLKDAKTAGLAGKQGPWTQYRDRMLKMRARAFALRDQFADVLKGIPVAEEISDYQPAERDITPRRPAEIAKAALPQPAERDDRLNTIIADLEFIAQEGGAASLADAWGGKSTLPCGVQMTTAERKAIGTEELDRLKGMTGEGQEPADAQEQDHD